MGTIYTIGYSSYSIEDFVNTLISDEINALIDVRSSPYSKMYSEFNKDNLKRYLNSKSIYYVFLGEECGARASENYCYRNGAVDFNCVSDLPRFKAGIKRITDGASKFNVALMCAEKDPITCHRTILVARHLKKYDYPIKHILANNGIETHEQLEKRLLKLFDLDQSHFYKTKNELLKEAYDLQAAKIAYRPAEQEAEVHEVDYD
ncbi:DUF488 domain-containing protein [Pseudodesulfovibrio karagichevae]|uniref:DUF488 family protein n=1 Tax=Pseudodesulfovibrio karagichevae TaxID=3239305 RepID=A0ABV4K7B9_9BACT